MLWLLLSFTGISVFTDLLFFYLLIYCFSLIKIKATKDFFVMWQNSKGLNFCFVFVYLFNVSIQQPIGVIFKKESFSLWAVFFYLIGFHFEKILWDIFPNVVKTVMYFRCTDDS